MLSVQGGIPQRKRILIFDARLKSFDPRIPRKTRAAGIQWSNADVYDGRELLKYNLNRFSSDEKLLGMT